MAGVPDSSPERSEQHRRRRRAAFERAADAHLRAADVHEQAAAFFELHGEPDKAAHHREAAELERRRAQSATDTAAAQ